MDKYNVCIIGQGAWAGAIANIVARNVERLQEFNKTVVLFDFDFLNEINKRKSTFAQISMERLDTLEYQSLPKTVSQTTDIVEAGKRADILIFVLEMEKLKTAVAQLHGMVSPTSFAISMVRDLTLDEHGAIELSTKIIERELNIRSSKLVGANLPVFHCAGEFCEAVIGCHDAKYARLMLELLKSDNFRLCIVDDVDSVEIYSKLKLIIAFGCGLMDGLEYGEAARAAVIRMGIQEMIKFLDTFYPGGKMSTFFESVGISDLINACFGHRNRVIAEAFVRSSHKNLKLLETDMLQGSRSVATKCAGAIHLMLQKKGLEAEYPLFTTIHKITHENEPPESLKNVIRNGIDEIYHPSNILPL